MFLLYDDTLHHDILPCMSAIYMATKQRCLYPDTFQTQTLPDAAGVPPCRAVAFEKGERQMPGVSLQSLNWSGALFVVRNKRDWPTFLARK